MTAALPEMAPKPAVRIPVSLLAAMHRDGSSLFGMSKDIRMVALEDDGTQQIGHAETKHGRCSLWHSS